MAGSRSAKAALAFRSALSTQLRADFFAGLESSLAVRPLTATAVLSLLAGAARKAGPDTLQPTASANAALQAVGYRHAADVPLAQATYAFILVSACESVEPASEQVGLLTRAYRSSSNEERV